MRGGGSSNGEISVEDLVDKGRIREARWVRDRETRERGFDEVWVYVLGLVAIF